MWHRISSVPTNAVAKTDWNNAKRRSQAEVEFGSMKDMQPFTLSVPHVVLRTNYCQQETRYDVGGSVRCVEKSAPKIGNTFEASCKSACAKSKAGT